MALALLLLLLIVTVYVQSHSSCCIPHPTNIHWLSYAKPPCLHPGQPIFEWPAGSDCSQRLALHSEQISLDESGLVFAKQRLCFYSTVEMIEYTFKCKGDARTGRFKIGHPKLSKQRRFKRWLRRRNPDPNAIHFQQESYVKELLESASPGTLVVAVKATHAADQPLYYSLAAPQDSRSQNIFTLDTISGEIGLAKSLGREILDKHVLNVTAYERLDPTVSSSVRVTVDVWDVQDNSPIFERDSYFADIREDAPEKARDLHWYHHAKTFVYAAITYSKHQAWAPWSLALNLTVHTIMYFYFGVRALKIQTPRPVAKFITTIQIVQFFILCYIFAHLVIIKTYNQIPSGGLRMEGGGGRTYFR